MSERRVALLAHRLLRSLDEADPGVDVEARWREEVRLRIDEIEAGTVELEDWDVVREGLRATTRS